MAYVSLLTPQPMAHTLRRLLSLAVVTTGLVALPSVHAALLTPAHEAQLEAWLGQGNLNLTNIYTKAVGDDAYDFHAAVDGQGPSFTLISIYGTGGVSGPAVSSQVIGGYNPTSWLSDPINGASYNMTSDRSAFLFNLTSGVRQTQNVDSSGDYQTVKGAYYGPTFGGGHDLHVQTDLAAGYANNFSYGGTSGTEIVSGTPNYFNYFHFYVADIEVYTFTPGPPQGVPDTAGTFALIGASLLGLAALRRRR